MCGIVGFYSPAIPDVKQVITNMTATLSHRGPDDSGTWVFTDGLAFGHRRLSIIDLSPEGHQPMESASGRYVITFNGEIFNYRAIAVELAGLGHKFRGQSDTEVMLAAFEQWGVPAALERFVGMFAFGLWDNREQVLFLVRDRLGIKPLYFGFTPKSLIFASELRPFLKHPEFTPQINRNAVALFHRFGYVPAPESIYQRVYKLLPGHYLVLDKRDLVGSDPVPIPYWSAQQLALAGANMPFAGSKVEAFAEVERLLRNSIGLRMIADVPLGAFLSGGIDSSTVVALMQAQSPRPVKTFSIGFHERGFDEASYASDVAKILGTEHTELYLTQKDALDVIPLLPTIYDEPFADSSQIPTYLVSKLARTKVSVSLSGDGGDELFAGYNRYIWAQKAWSFRSLMGPLGSRAIFPMLKLIGPATWDVIFQTLGPILPKAFRTQSPGEKLFKFLEIAATEDKTSLYLKLVSHWQNGLIPDQSSPVAAIENYSAMIQDLSYLEQMQLLDLLGYLPDDILTKVDRASMAVGLEARVPILDHRLVEFAWRLPSSYKTDNRTSKLPLRHILAKHLPMRLINRPKMGFAVPIGDWLRGELRPWAEELLEPKHLAEQGFLSVEQVSTKWREHLSQKRNWQYYLWDVLMFQAWITNSNNSVDPIGQVQIGHP